MGRKKKDWFQQLIDSGIPKDLINGFFNMIGQISQSMVANPVSAMVGGTIIIGLCERIGLIDKTKANIAFAATIGLTSVKPIVEAIDALIPDIGGRGDANAYPDTLVLVNTSNAQLPDWSKLLPKKT